MELQVLEVTKTGLRTCLACGEILPKRARRYCSKGCKEQIIWVLGLSQGLLKTFNVRYATFSFTEDWVILDLLPYWSVYVSRFCMRRTPGLKPALDLKRLILCSGEEWYGLLKTRHSKTSASLKMIHQNHRKDIDPASLIPKVVQRPKLSKREKEYLKLLDLGEEELFSDLLTQKIKTSYRKRAKLFHPDTGGDEELFKLLNEAHKHMLHWSLNPRYSFKRSLLDCWSYDSLTNRWSPPQGG